MHTSVLTSTIMFLILPILIIFGLVPLTQFAFNSVASDLPGSPDTSADARLSDISLPFKYPWNTLSDNSTKRTRTIVLSDRQMVYAQVSVVCTWILVILSILSWIGRAFGLWCIP
jgi:hypothetical protein